MSQGLSEFKPMQRPEPLGHAASKMEAAWPITKTHPMFSIHTTLEKLANARITADCGLVLEVNSIREIT